MRVCLCLLLCSLLSVAQSARITDVDGFLSRDGVLASQGMHQSSGKDGSGSELDEVEEISDKELLLLGVDPDDPEFCHQGKYRKRTMKLIKEMPFVGLFPKLQGQRRFEASGITFAKGAFWVVFDSLRALGRVDLRFSFRGPENSLVGSAAKNESQFEGLAYMASVDQFLMLRESFEHQEHGLVPLTEAARLTKDGNYEVVEQCAVQFPLESDNKGFESLVYYERDGERFLMGLCEGNHCAGGDEGRERGHGRLVVARYVAKDKDEPCSWEVEKVIKLPESVYFLDYADIAFLEDQGRDVAIVSQEDAAVWVGEFDWEEMEFKEDGTIYHFPRNDHCEKVYCNVEGLVWLDASRFVFTSDAAKKDQPYQCMDKDQSIHILALP